MGAFSSLTDKLQKAFAKLTGKGRLTEEDVNAAMKEVQMALLEADVSFKIVKDFVRTVKEKAIGSNILESLTPGQQVIDLVNKELVELLGGDETALKIGSKRPFVILMAGLQGSGKTTTAAKLAYLLKSQNKKPYLIAGDVYRPAAIDQLKTLAAKVGVPIFCREGDKDVLGIVRDGLKEASGQADVVIIDTAGRIHLDESMMEELIQVKDLSAPDETILVVDGMTGQDAVNIGREFGDKVGIDSLAVTKMDGDARGGAVISLKAVTGKPIKLIGMGEKIDQLEFFHPDRIASRILGMGDVLTLIEKAQAQFDEKEAQEMQKKLLEATFTLDDFLAQIRQIRGMGSLEDLIGMLPGAGKLKNLQVDESQLGKVEAIIFSMTPEERAKPQILGASRKKRIAAGSGTQVQDVNRLLKQFDSTRAMMKQFGNMGKKKKGMLPRLF